MHLKDDHKTKWDDITTGLNETDTQDQFMITKDSILKKAREKSLTSFVISFTFHHELNPVTIL